MSETKLSTPPAVPLIVKISCVAAWAVAFALWALDMAMFAGWQGFQRSGAPEYITIVILVFAVVLAWATYQVWRGSSWACFVPIGCLLALAVVWVRGSIDGTVSVVAIAVALVMAAALAAVWVAPRQVRAFYTATDELMAGRKSGAESSQPDANASGGQPLRPDGANSVSDDQPAGQADANSASEDQRVV